MNITAIIQRLTGSKRSDEANRCPREAGILAYSEDKVSASERNRIESHLAKCDDCRELLAATTHETETRTAESMSEKEIKQQAARVLAYIELDESRRGRSAGQPTTRRARSRAGLHLPSPRLASAALVLSAVAAGAVMLITSDRRSDPGGDAAGMATLRQAMKDERRNQPLISGGLPYAPYSPKRGGGDSDDLNYERALDKVKFADNETAPVEARHTRARILLAEGGRDNVRKALVILDQLEAAGGQSAELLNDLGVAWLQLGDDYNRATAYFTRALQKSPGASEYLFNKALAEQKAGRVDEARQDWNQFISSTSDDRLKAEARSQLSLLR